MTTAHTDGQSPLNRAARLQAILVQSGLARQFSVVEELEPQYDDFTKKKVAANGLGILSFELSTHATKPETLRMHFKRSTPDGFRQALAKIPGASLSPTVGANFSGDLLAAATGISQAVDAWHRR